MYAIIGRKIIGSGILPTNGRANTKLNNMVLGDDDISSFSF